MQPLNIVEKRMIAHFIWTRRLKLPITLDNLFFARHFGRFFEGFIRRASKP